MDEVQTWLYPPWPYLKDFASISWSPSEDALVYDHGETFILRQPLAQFIDGFSSERTLIHFGYMLHLVDIFLKEKMHRPKVCHRLRQLMKQPGVSYRNAGRLAAHITPKVTTLAKRGLAEAVHDRLANPLRRLFDGEPSTAQNDVTATMEMKVLYDLPALTPLEFENLIGDELSKFSEADLKYWLRTGEAPTKCELILPVLQSAAWEERMMANERLRGVAPFLAPLLSALTLPPRRLLSNDLPLGGYANVTNRGRIDALLPTQFALDPDDFIRRFAENELLYFRREDPVSLPEADVLIILDQGIRTWGAARLRLTAAAVALASKAQAHGRRVYLATSNQHGALRDVNEYSAAQLAEALERSDLTAHPSHAINMLAESTKEQTLDIVLLSHPLNLVERAVVVANQLFHADCRLFALTVDEQSNATWGEIKHGELTKVQRFHLEPAAQVQRRPQRSRLASAKQLAWGGSSEKYASPFQVPLRNRVVDVDFDFDDDWLFVLDSASRVMAYSLQTPKLQSRLLPRVMEKGDYPSFDGLVGVPNGVVAYRQDKGNEVLLAHLDMQEHQSYIWRVVDTPPMTLSTQDFSSGYRPEHQKMRQLDQRFYLASVNQLVLTDSMMMDIVTYDVAKREARIAHRTMESPRVYKLLKENSSLCRRPDQWGIDPMFLDSNTGEVRLGHTEDAYRTLCCPMSNGKPALWNCSLVEAQQGGDTLCLLVTNKSETRSTLFVYQKPDYRCIGEWRDITFFKLSASGRYLALRLHPFCVQVLDLHQNNNLVLRTRSGNKVRVREMCAGAGWLHVQYSQSNFLIDWRTDALQCSYRKGQPEWTQDKVRQSTAVELTATHYKDTRVYRRHLTFEHRVEADELGQLWVHDLDGKLVCVFLIDQTDMAGWMPDGTTFGPVRLVGHDSPPDAMNRFAAALRNSSRRQP